MSIRTDWAVGAISPPQDIEAERRVLGIILKYPQTIDTVISKLGPDHFYDAANRAVYRAMLAIYQEGGKVSYTQVFNQLRKEGKIPDPEHVLLALTEAFASQAELEPSIRVLMEQYVKRAILHAAQEIERMILLDSEPSLEACRARAQELIFQATQIGGPEQEIKDLADILSRCYNNLVERKEGKVAYGLPVRYPSIDVLTTGFKKKDLIILAGRPSMGKTALALNFAVNVARCKHRRQPVLIFSLEMDDEQIGDRLVISEFFRYRRDDGSLEVSPLDYAARMDDEKFARVDSIFNELYKLPIKVVDKRGLTTAELRAMARQVKAEEPDLALIIIDYLQLLKPATSTNKNWALVVGDAVREIRDLAGELDVPVILLSQLNRGVEARDNKRPALSDLRDSGNIEEFADVVMFVYRDEYYYPDEAEERNTKGQAEIIIAKQRRGQTGKAILKFIPECTRFVDITDRVEE
ncbi:MAG: replicative DNA helicase [Firmicutes bacterium]|nr:replicative DNA helicase [Bacillota bacterium]